MTILSKLFLGSWVLLWLTCNFVVHYLFLSRCSFYCIFWTSDHQVLGRDTKREGGRIRFKEVHGYGRRWKSWGELLLVLPTLYRCIVPDLSINDCFAAFYCSPRTIHVPEDLDCHLIIIPLYRQHGRTWTSGLHNWAQLLMTSLHRWRTMCRTLYLRLSHRLDCNPGGHFRTSHMLWL